MRYRFDGLKRESGQPVKGHVEARSQEHAYGVLGDHGIVVEDLAADPQPGDDSQVGLSGAIDRALDASSKQIRFDDLTRRYQGKRVWVINREKIKRQVVQTVDEAVRQSQRQSEDSDATRDRITEALENLFGDTRNITSPVSTSGENMAAQVDRLTIVVSELERAVGTIQGAVRFPGSAGPRAIAARRVDRASDKVLAKIFNHNMELRKRLSGAPASKPAPKTPKKGQGTRPVRKGM